MMGVGLQTLGECCRENGSHSEKAGHDQRHRVPVSRHRISCVGSVIRPGHVVHRHVAPSLGDHKRRGAAFRAESFRRSGELTHPGASRESGKVGSAEPERLVPTGSRRSPCGHGAHVGSQCHPEAHFQTRQLGQWNPPCAGHVDDPDHAVVDNHAWTPEEHPGTEAREGKKWPASNQCVRVAGSDESAEGAGNQEHGDHGEASPQWYAKYGARLLHAVSLPQCLVGSERG